MSAEQTPDIELVLADLDSAAWEAWHIFLSLSVTPSPLGDRMQRHHQDLKRIRGALAPVLAAAVRDAKAEALREAADGLDSEGHRWLGGAARRYFAAADDLRGRADRVAEPQHEAATVQRRPMSPTAIAHGCLCPTGLCPIHGGEGAGDE